MNHNILRINFLIFLVACTYTTNAQTLQPKGKTVLQNFALQDVTLTDSKWKEQLDETKEYYLRIPNDDMLKGFRERMHKPTNGAHEMGGWYSIDVCNPFGQIISGLTRLYAATGDERCKQKVDALIKGWAECIDTSGYFFYSDSLKTQHYTYEKMLCGLIDAYTYADNKNAMQYAGVITDWAIKHLSRNLMWSGEWYTLPENLYKAYLITGDKKYYNFAKEWEYTSFWGGIREDTLFQSQPGYHAYSHLNTFSSCAMAYMATGDDTYKQTLTNAYDYFNTQQVYPSGGFGPNESLMKDSDRLNATYKTHATFETQCGSWAIFKLCKYLLTITGDARYGDWIEKALINGVGASIPMSADGRVMYYSDYNVREGYKYNCPDPWTCCSGTRPQAVSEYQDLIYFKSSNGLYINLFIPSAIQYNGLELTQSTFFPEQDKTTLTIHAKTSSPTTLFIRRPKWLKEDATITINGKPYKASIKNNWLVIEHNWKDDVISIELPMQFSFQQVSAQKTFPVGLMYGPIAMAIRTGSDNYPTSLLTTSSPWNSFTKVAGEPLTFHTNDTSLLVRPFYDFEENEPYVILLDSSVQNQIGNHNITVTGNWRAWYQFTDDVGASITAKFNGTGFKLTGAAFDDAGMIAITVDNKITKTFDEYNKQRGVPFEAVVDGLEQGNHIAVVTTLKETNKDSRNRFVNYATIERIP